VPTVAPVAVEPREIIPPPDSANDTSKVAVTKAAIPNVEDLTVDGKKSFPLIPLLAGFVALVVVGLLGKVLIAK
jgi:hypothetical protein